MAALTDALAGHVRAEGVNVVLDCVVDRISTADADAVVVEGVHVRERPSGNILVALVLFCFEDRFANLLIVVRAVGCFQKGIAGLRDRCVGTLKGVCRAYEPASLFLQDSVTLYALFWGRCCPDSALVERQHVCFYQRHGFFQHVIFDSYPRMSCFPRTSLAPRQPPA